MKKKSIILSVLEAALSSAFMISIHNWKKNTGKPNSLTINFFVILGLLPIMSGSTTSLDLWPLIHCDCTFSFLQSVVQEKEIKPRNKEKVRAKEM